jgi:hypothetical protein
VGPTDEVLFSGVHFVKMCSFGGCSGVLPHALTKYEKLLIALIIVTVVQCKSYLSIPLFRFMPCLRKETQKLSRCRPGDQQSKLIIPFLNYNSM